MDNNLCPPPNSKGWFEKQNEDMSGERGYLNTSYLQRFYNSFLLYFLGAIILEWGKDLFRGPTILPEVNELEKSSSNSKTGGRTKQKKQKPPLESRDLESSYILWTVPLSSVTFITEVKVCQVNILPRQSP